MRAELAFADAETGDTGHPCPVLGNLGAGTGR